MLNQGRPTASFVVSCMTLTVHNVDVDSIEVPHTDTPVSHDKADKEGATAIVPGEVQEPTEEDEASKGWTDNVIRNFTSVWKQDPRIQEFKAEGSRPYEYFQNVLKYNQEYISITEQFFCTLRINQSF